MGPAIRAPPSCVCEGSSGREWETESKVSSCSGISATLFSGIRFLQLYVTVTGTKHKEIT